MSYVRTGPTDRDKLFTDIGTLQVITEGLPNAGQVGELWVSYNVKLSRAQLYSTITPTSAQDIFWGAGQNAGVVPIISFFDITAAQLAVNSWSVLFSSPLNTSLPAAALSNSLGFSCLSSLSGPGQPQLLISPVLIQKPDFMFVL